MSRIDSFRNRDKKDRRNGSLHFALTKGVNALRDSKSTEVNSNKNESMHFQERKSFLEVRLSCLRFHRKARVLNLIEIMRSLLQLLSGIRQPIATQQRRT